MQEDGVEVIEHAGGNEGFSSFMIYAPQRRIAVVALGNVNGAAPVAMAEQLIKVVLGISVTAPNEREPVAIAREALTKFTGVFDVLPSGSLLEIRMRRG